MLFSGAYLNIYYDINMLFLMRRSDADDPMKSVTDNLEPQLPITHLCATPFGLVRRGPFMVEPHPMLPFLLA